MCVWAGIFQHIYRLDPYSALFIGPTALCMFLGVATHVIQAKTRGKQTRKCCCCSSLAATGFGFTP